VNIRAARRSDHGAIARVVTAAFGQPDEAAIIDRVRGEGAALCELVAVEAELIVGHALFSRMRVKPEGFFAALGPLAVAPGRQGCGIGGALTVAGLDELRQLGVDAVVVLGHPAYYPRWGFSPQAAALLASPYAGRPAFMATALRPGALDAPRTVAYPAAFG
jgi:putative acetyltransferase